MTKFRFKSKLWVYPGMAAWRFLNLPVKESKIIKELFGGAAKGWGSLPVHVTIGTSRWKTSIFPDKKRGCYLLPIKKDIRKQNKINDEDIVNFIIEIKI